MEIGEVKYRQEQQDKKAQLDLERQEAARLEQKQKEAYELQERERIESQLA